MGCRNDYMAPDQAERHSQETAQSLVYLTRRLVETGSLKANLLQGWVYSAASSIYGDRHRADELTRMLCETIRGMDTDDRDRIIYNGCDPEARKLANWWDEHQEWDRRREEGEARKREAERVKRAEGHADEMTTLVRDLLDGLPLLKQTEQGKRLVEILAEIEAGK